jgi:Ca2+-binding EF-hand superfamily protein
MTSEDYERVMKEIFDECCSDGKGNITKEGFKHWMVVCSKANNQTKENVEKLIAKPDIHFYDIYSLIDTSRDGLLQWDEIWHEVKEGKDKL